MTRSSARNWLIALSLSLGWGAVAGCEGDPVKRLALADGGEGGDGAAVNGGEGGSRAPASHGGDPAIITAGAAGAPGAAGAAGAVSPGTGGMPVDVPPVGGMPSLAGTPNEPSAGAPAVLPQCQGELTFQDAYVELQVRNAIGILTGPITAADVAGLDKLAIPFNDSDINMTGIECLSALTTLDFSGGGGGTPIELLAELPNLRSIDYSNGYLTDLTGLEQVTQLTSLNLSDNNIADLTALGSLVNLVSLNLDGVGPFGQVPVDISPLASLTKLKTLDVGRVVIADGAPLGSLTQLDELVLAGAKLASLAPVSGLTNLRALDISSTNITAIPSLTAFTKLVSLDISGNTISDFTPLALRTSLTSLRAASTTLSSLGSIAPLTALTSLDVSYNALTDITTLGALPALSKLDISYNPITSVHPLVTSTYIASGDSVDVTAVGDCSTPYLTDFQALIDKGVLLANACGL